MKNSAEPCNVEAETWLLGGVFNDPKTMSQHSASLSPDDFYMEKHRLIWQAMQELQSAGVEIDIVSVGSKLKERHEFQSLFGSNDYLFGLMESVVSASNIDHYAELVSKASTLRKLISAAGKIMRSASEPDAIADELLATALGSITAIAEKSVHSEGRQIADIVEEYLSNLKERIASGMPMGADSGYFDLDFHTGGFRNGELTILGARPGMGKTSLALDIAMEASRKIPVKFFSIEMDKGQIAAKAACFLSHINLKETVNAKLDAFSMEAQAATIPELRRRNLDVDFNINRIEEITSAVCAFAAKNKNAGLVIIDHLHFMAISPGKYENRNIELGKITRALKQLAKKTSLPILLLAQLNRDVDKTHDKKPKLSDLRDSGSIEQDADVVLFLHRPGYYAKEKHSADEAEVIISKNRMGPTGTAKMCFDPGTTRFTEAKNGIGI